jgi:hypothetical protein
LLPASCWFLAWRTSQFCSWNPAIDLYFEPYESRLHPHFLFFPPRRPGFEPGSGHVGLGVDKVAREQAFSEYCGFPCQFAFHRLLHYHHLSSGASTIVQTAAAVTVDSVSHLRQRKKLFYFFKVIFTSTTTLTLGNAKVLRHAFIVKSTKRTRNLNALLWKHI